MKEHPEDFELRIEHVLHAFKQLADHCEHKSAGDQDCHHPKKDFDCMLCDPSNCPLLLSS